MQRTISTCMLDRIEDTIAILSKLKSPVMRTCHIGNNTPNNWGFLLLGKNTKLKQYDHTLYGIDLGSAPWLIIGDYGIILECFGYNGIHKKEVIGKHMNLYAVNNEDDTKYHRILNYSILARYANQNIIHYHYNIANKLSMSINKQSVTCDTNEILSILSLLKSVFYSFLKSKNIDLLLDRWIKKSAKGYAVVYRIEKILYRSCDIIEVYVEGNYKIFSGKFELLWNSFCDGVKAVHDKIFFGQELNNISYPWLTLAFIYTISHLKEYQLDSQQNHFWHAGGSASQYYINSKQFSIAIEKCITLLIEYGYLPPETKISIIPSYCCQVFATNCKSLEVLEELLDVWQKYATKKDNFETVITSLSNSITPLYLIKKTFSEINISIIRQLSFLLNRFNELDINKLPIANISSYNHPSYNKYGISQHSLTKKELFFPKALHKWKWGEAELFTKILAEIRINDFS